VGVPFGVSIIAVGPGREGNGPIDFAVLWLFATSDLVNCMVVEAKFAGQYSTGWDRCIFIYSDNQLPSSPFKRCPLQLKLDRLRECLHGDFNLRRN
jgi:hypothetical protein